MLPSSLRGLWTKLRDVFGGGCDAAPGIALKPQCVRHIREGAGCTSFSAYVLLCLLARMIKLTPIA